MKLIPPAASLCDANYRTVLWIGSRDHNHLIDAYQHTERHCWQIAHRHDLREAIDRPASQVDLMVVAADERASVHPGDRDELQQRHPACKRLLLRGPLCEGMRMIGGSTVGPDDFFSGGRYDWLHASEVLASLLDHRYPSNEASHASTIAVVASHYAAAEPLMEIAEATDCAAVWCRHPSDNIIRGVDSVWWDDSFAGPTDVSQWRHRLQSMGAKASRHAWITNRTHWLQVDQAKQAGVGLVLTKPYDADLLRRFVGAQDQAERMTAKAA